MAKQESQDSIRIKERKGTWRRFVKLFTKCRLPWLLLLLYIGLEVVFVNVGVDQTDAMAQLFAGDTSAPVLAKVIGLIVANLVLANLVVFTRAVTSARIDRNMRTALTDKILRLPMRFFKSENPRDTIYRISYMKFYSGGTLPGAVKKNLRTSGEGGFLDPNKKTALGFSLRPLRLKNL